MKPYAAEYILKAGAFVLGVAIVAAAMFFSSCASTTASRHAVQTASAVPVRMPESLERVHFDFGSDQLNAEERDRLGNNIDWLNSHGDSVLVLEGHCDERGDVAYNMQLGDRRARSVKGYLIAQGIEQDRLIMVVSHGELRPLNPGHNRDAYRQNRRVEFIVR
jgi:outer membrane protein OmpA-like peptidoglycan-associated protein